MEVDLKQPDLFKDIIPSLTFTKEHLIDENKLEPSKYPYVVVNKHFSFSSETIFLANEMNKVQFTISPKQQYDFWFYILEPKKRFDKWIKSPEEDENFSIVKEYYNCSDLKAKQYLKVLTKDQINIIKKRTTKE